jgi:hypothetical protein
MEIEMKVTDSPAERSTASGLRRAAMAYLAAGRTAGQLYANASDPKIVAGVALLAGRCEDDVRDQMLAVAIAVDVITREGITPEQCRFLVGEDGVPS